MSKVCVANPDFGPWTLDFGRRSDVGPWTLDFGQVRSITPFERFGQSNPAPDANLDQYVFRAGDTISGLANRFYGDWRQWRLIADQNGLVDVRQIAPGTRLLIPPAPLQAGTFESG